MSIAIFQEITTEEYLLEIEAEGKKYVGLYVDMANAPERKFVKEQAANIKAMLKRLDNERIAKSRDYRVTVEKEAATIKERLEVANSPYTLLIDSYAADCKKVRDAEKAMDDARSLAIEKEGDHEHALLLDNQVMYEKHLAEENRIKYEAKLKKDAAAEAVERVEQDAYNARIADEAAQAKREANKKHCASINNKVLSALIGCGITREQGKEIIKKIVKGEVPSTSIQY